MKTNMASIPRFKTTPLVVLLLSLIFLSGCSGKGPKIAPVTGRVTFKGAPVSDGAKIYFANKEKGVHITAILDADGRYRIEMAEGYGLPPGDYGVSLLPPMLQPSAEMIEKYRAGGPPAELMAFPKIPLRYRKPETSMLVLKLTEDGATFDVEMMP